MSAELLAQIAAAPDDDSLRAVYADELIAAGDPRGELISTELALATTPNPDERATLFRRRFELRAEHAQRWWELAPWQVYTRRGFASRVTLAHVETPPAWLQREPVGELQLCLLRSSPLERIFDAGHLPAVRRLVLVNAAPTWLEALRRSPLADTLESLELCNCELDNVRDEPWDAFPALRRVRVSGLVRCHPWMIGWEGFARLQELELPGCRVDDERFSPLLENARSLRSIDVSGYGYGDVRTAQLVARLRALPRITRVVANGCDAYTDADLEPLLDLVETRAPTGEHWRFERVATDRWRVFVDGVMQPISSYRDGRLLPPADTASMRRTIARLATGGGWCALAVGDDALSLTLGEHGATQYCYVTATVGSALRVFDADENRARAGGA